MSEGKYLNRCKPTFIHGNFILQITGGALVQDGDYLENKNISETFEDRFMWRNIHYNEALVNLMKIFRMRIKIGLQY